MKNSTNDKQSSKACMESLGNNRDNSEWLAYVIHCNQSTGSVLCTFNIVVVIVGPKSKTTFKD